jgi:peroxiredoxin
MIEGGHMNRRCIILLAVFFLLSGASAGCNSLLAADQPPAVGVAFPDITLSAPKTGEAQDYLGVRGKAAFKISQVQAQLVVLEIFSMYCPYCQREAPQVNEFYQLIAKRQDLKDKIRVIGVGAGNSDYEVQIFKEKYAVLFPLFSDENFAAHDAVGRVRTPYFFGIRINPDGTNRIIYSKVGTIQDPQQFLELLLQQADLK